MKPIKPFLLFSILVLFIQCKKNVEIKGHWHIESKINNGYMTIDVINDTIAYIGLNSIEGRLRGKHNKKDGLLMFPGSCGAGFFQYYIKGQKIFLTNALETKTHGLKCDSCCNKLQDFSKDIDLDIDFPTIKDKVKYEITKLNYNYPSLNIQIGKPKTGKETLLSDSVVIDLYRQYIPLTLLHFN